MSDLCSNPSSRWQPWSDVEPSYVAAELSFLRTRHALLFPDTGLVMTRPGRVLWGTVGEWTAYHRTVAGFEGLDGRAPALRTAAVRPTRVYDRAAVSLCHVYAQGFGHWLTDCLPVVPDLLDGIRAGRLRVLTFRLQPWRRRTLELVGVPAASIDELDGSPVICSDLVCNSYGGTVHTYRPSSALRWVFDRLRSVAAAATIDQPPRLVYASRRLLDSWRRFTTEADLERALIQIGFAIVHPERMTLDEQISTFARTEVLVGAHGSALANVGFAPPGCLVVDIVPDRMPHQWIYAFTRQLGHRLVVLVAGHDDGQPSDQAASGFAFHREFAYRVDPDLVVESVRIAMAQSGVAPA